MSAERHCRSATTRLKLALCCGLIGCGAGAALADEELPDLALLEYLGSWEESDEDWLVISELSPVAGRQEEDERNDPVPEGEESTESQDES